jgi:hypothetical protein
MLVCADDVNLLGANIDTVKKISETLIGASKEVGIEVNTENPKFILLPRHQNAGKNLDINIANTSFENVIGNDSNKSKFDSGGN